jgi:glycolate oxidase iron-sulfur subunit
VQFGYFMDGLRQQLHDGDKTSDTRLETLLEDNTQSQRLHRLLRVSHVSGAQKLAGLLPGKLGRLARSLPAIHKLSRPRPHYPASTNGQQHVQLFRGCTQTVFGSALFDTSIEVLNRLGVSVDVPTQQGCCGALSQHNGNAERAHMLAANNLRAFGTKTSLPVITLASGCAAALKDYAKLAADDAGAAGFAQQVMDISHYLASLNWPADVIVRPLNQRVVVHTPCSLRNVLRQERAVFKLLAQIPGADVIPLEAGNSCCGAAGSYMFEDEHRDLSDTLAGETVEALRQQDADLVVTSNIGCAMQLQVGLKRAGLKIRVLHPVELLAQQLNPN